MTEDIRQMKTSLTHLIILLHNMNKIRKTKLHCLYLARWMNFLCDLCLVLVPDAGRESHESELSRELARLVWRISSSVSWATCRVL